MAALGGASAVGRARAPMLGPPRGLPSELKSALASSTAANGGSGVMVVYEK